MKVGRLYISIYHILIDVVQLPQNSVLLLPLLILNTSVYQELRKDWVSVLMIVTSARSSINIRHLEKATVSTGKEGLLSEGNAAYNWSRCTIALIWQWKLVFIYLYKRANLIYRMYPFSLYFLLLNLCFS